MIAVYYVIQTHTIAARIIFMLKGNLFYPKCDSLATYLFICPKYIFN